MKKQILKLVAVLGIALFSLKGNAQCPPYNIQNNLMCNVTVNIDIYDTPPAGCTNICNSITGMVLQANQPNQINCGTCGNICNIVITVTNLGTTSGSWGPFDFGTTSATNITTVSPPCLPMGTTMANITFDGTWNFIINP